MKRVLAYSPLVLCVIYLFFSLSKGISSLAGYDFQLYYPSVTLAVLAGLSLAVTVALFLFKISVNKVNGVLSALLLPLSILNGLYYLSGNWGLHMAFILICCGCAVAILIKCTWPVALKILSAVLSGIFLLLIALAIPIASVFRGISTNTVVNAVPSPQNTYVAEVIDNDQGMLGGNTLIKIKDNGKIIPVLIGEFSPQPVCVYTGEWGEFENMQIYWKDEHTLVINGKVISING